VNVVCCQVEVFATSWSLVQRSPTECGVSECDRGASIMRRPWHARGCCAMKRKVKVKLSRCLIKHHTCGLVEIWLHAFIYLALERDELSDSLSGLFAFVRKSA
jgi:hypothetical protein